MILAISFLSAESLQTLSVQERTVLLEKVKHTKKLQRQRLREKFKKARAHKVRKKLRHKLRKTRFQKENRINRIKRKIHKLKVSP
jgi:hypothetical protein